MGITKKQKAINQFRKGMAYYFTKNTEYPNCGRQYNPREHFKTEFDGRLRKRIIGSEGVGRMGLYGEGGKQ